MSSVLYLPTSNAMDSSQLPGFDDLPRIEGMPQGCAWGIFDREGKKDLIGTLNLLTPSVVKAAYAEARDGKSISLKSVFSPCCWDIVEKTRRPAH